MYHNKPEEIQLMLDTNIGLLPRLFQLLDLDDPAIVYSALHIIIEILESGNKNQKQMILVDSGVTPVLVKLLNQAVPDIVENATILACLLTSTILKTRTTITIDSLFALKVVNALLNVLANGDLISKANAAKAITTIARGTYRFECF